MKYYVWDPPHQWKFCLNQIIRQCKSDCEFKPTVTFYHKLAWGDHFCQEKKRVPVKFQIVFCPRILYLLMHILLFLVKSDRDIDQFLRKMKYHGIILCCLWIMFRSR